MPESTEEIKKMEARIAKLDEQQKQLKVKKRVLRNRLSQQARKARTKRLIENVQQIIAQFNLQASNNGVILDNENSFQATTSKPLFGTHSVKQYRYYTANGYEYRDSKGHWHYVVTKSPFEAAFGVTLHGWEGALGGSWKSGHEK